MPGNPFLSPTAGFPERFIFVLILRVQMFSRDRAVQTIDWNQIRGARVRNGNLAGAADIAIGCRRGDRRGSGSDSGNDTFIRDSCDRGIGRFPGKL